MAVVSGRSAADVVHQWFGPLRWHRDGELDQLGARLDADGHVTRVDVLP
jgi:hypothetical protein